MSFLAVVTDMTTGAKSLVSVEAVAGQGVDPGYGIPDFGGGNYPSGGPVRPQRPVDPGYGQGRPGFTPVDPGYGQGVVRPDRPSNELPPLPPDPVRPGNPIVLPPQIGTLPVFPLEPGNELPGVPPGTIYPPLPPNVPQGKAIVLVAISGVGARWAVIDTSLSAGMPLPPAPEPK